MQASPDTHVNLKNKNLLTYAVKIFKNLEYPLITITLIINLVHWKLIL